MRIMLPKDFKPKTVLDPGAGGGIFGDAAKEVFPGCVVDGIDIRSPLPKPDSYRHWWTGDFLMDNESLDYAKEHGGYDLIVGNPPYGKLGEAFVRRSMQMVNEGGIVLFLFRFSFAGSEGRIIGLYQDHPLTSVGLISPRPSFLGKDKNGKQLSGTDSDEYAFFRHDNPPSKFRTVLEYVYHGSKTLEPDTRQLSFL